uniref:Calreticulin n=1 Tax=Triticum urartu TaxID=4572 RepID=A0A8R7TC91_TRIUA
RRSAKQTFVSANDFEPALIPSKTIPDPDKKPDDWDERAKIPDPDAVKPDDWDENAPIEIVDEKATKPEGWLVDEPEEIDDPEAASPDRTGMMRRMANGRHQRWTTNPKCKKAPGCGKWKKPMKDNPAYKGKWHAPLIDNPNYKGSWKPQEIPNLEYYIELDKPDFDPIAAI